MIFYRLYNNKFYNLYETDKLGFSDIDAKYIPNDYLSKKEFVVFRTCLGFGDWGIISSMPRLLKQKYPDCKVYLPSEFLLRKLFGDGSQWGSWSNPLRNVYDVFANNPYVDEYLDSVEGDVFHDHYRLYDDSNTEQPLILQMLKFWGFHPNELEDYLPELYFSDEEKQIGDKIIYSVMDGKQFDAILLSNTDKSANLRKENSMLLTIPTTKNYFYYGDEELTDSIFKDFYRSFDFKKHETPIRIQLYIRSKAKCNIGYESGLTTSLCRYTDVISTIKSERIKSNFLPNIKYLRY